MLNSTQTVNGSVMTKADYVRKYPRLKAANLVEQATKEIPQLGIKVKDIYRVRNSDKYKRANTKRRKTTQTSSPKAMSNKTNGMSGSAWLRQQNDLHSAPADDLLKRANNAGYNFSISLIYQARSANKAKKKTGKKQRRTNVQARKQTVTQRQSRIAKTDIRRLKLPQDPEVQFRFLVMHFTPNRARKMINKLEQDLRNAVLYGK